MFDTIIPIYDGYIWIQLEYFIYTEKWGNPDKMDVRLLFALDRIRHRLGRKVIVHCGYELSGHADRSLHKIGAAIDFHVFNTSKYELNTLYKFFSEYWSGGVGVYPYWTPCLGFHVDLGAPHRRWIVDQHGNYYYDETMIKRIMYEYITGENE